MSLTSPSTRYRSPVTRMISVVEVVGGSWPSLELIWSGWLVRAGRASEPSQRPSRDRAVGVDEPIGSSAWVGDLARYGSHGATVMNTGGVAAREVLAADAANLLANDFAPAREGDQMPLYVASTLGASVSIDRPGEATS